MAHKTPMLNYDVAVIGGGAAGVGAAIAAAKNGARTLLIEAGPMLGGEMLTGMSINGALNARGQYVVGGVAAELFEECKKIGGFIGPVHDYRLICYVALDPELIKIAIAKLIHRYSVTPLLYSLVDEVVMNGSRVEAIGIVNKHQRALIKAEYFIDCSGDADIAALAGAPFELGDKAGTLQPLSIMFRMSGVENTPLLSFVREHPENLAVGESEYIRAGRTDAQLAQAIYDQGQPSVFFKAEGPLLQGAIERGDLFPTALIMTYPTSTARREVCVNATRVAENIDGTQVGKVSAALPRLLEQVLDCASYLQKNVPGFANASIAAIAPRVGIRETRRIVGEARLTGDDVRNARKSESGVAKGCHHIDIHGEGVVQVRIPVANGGSYDIPWGCLLPKTLANVYVAGRCLSADREGHGSARNMGNCLAMGHAVGAAAALSVAGGMKDIRDLPLPKLRDVLREQGAVLDGVY
jgi:hypothetical protein